MGQRRRDGAPASALLTYAPSGASKTRVVPADSDDWRGRIRAQHWF